MKIILCSKSNIKESIIKKWFNDRKNIEIEVKKIDIKNELIPPQPIGNDIKLICLKKINDIKDNYNDVDCIISIENFLDIMEDVENRTYEKQNKEVNVFIEKLMKVKEEELENAINKLTVNEEN